MDLTSIVRAAGAVAIVTASVATIPEALAQDPTTVQSGPVQPVKGSAQAIILTMGKGQLFKTSVPFTKVSVTDDKIVEVTPQSNREFVFTPKGVGSTNVLIFDEKNALIATLDINVESSIHEARREVHEETYDEVPGRVRIFNAPWRGTGGAGGRSSFASPSYYHCTPSNCEFAGITSNGSAGPPAGDALHAGPGPTQAPPASQAHPPAEGEPPQ